VASDSGRATVTVAVTQNWPSEYEPRHSGTATVIGSCSDASGIMIMIIMIIMINIIIIIIMASAASARVARSGGSCQDASGRPGPSGSGESLSLNLYQ
jgi:hypothetical protein